MRIFFNCSVNRKGGAIQNAANFIVLARQDPSHSYLFAVSHEVYDLLDQWGEVDDRIYRCEHPLSSGNARGFIRQLEKGYRPDIVYTMAGPTYVRFSAPHVLGISDPYITHADTEAFFYERSFSDALVHVIKSFAKGFLSRIEGDYFLFQTDFAGLAYRKRYFLRSSRSKIVPNAVGRSFDKVVRVPHSKQGRSGQPFAVFCPSADYPHKDLSIIRRIAEYLATGPSGTGWSSMEFTVTVPDSSGFSCDIAAVNRLSDKLKVKNHGPFSYADALELYMASDVVFMPSILETFSTSYLEALACGRPLVVPAKEFAKDACGGAAVYYRATDARSAYCALVDVFQGKVPSKDTVEKVLTRYGTYEQRYDKIIRALSEFHNSTFGEGVDV